MRTDVSRGSFCLFVSTTALLLLGRLSVSQAPSQQSDSSAHALDVMRVSPLVFSGPTPEGDAAMRRLAGLGIRTVVSVDGARPEVAAAAAAGLSYVHIPIGYDGVPESAKGALTRVMTQCPLPVYVHCHHGKHRGPTAAAACALIASEIDRTQALVFLESAGTSPSYPGLWESVGSFEALPPGTTLPPLVSVAEVAPLVETMLHIDERVEMLTTLIEHQRVDSEMQRIARLLHEDFRESTRLLGSDWPPGMVRFMQAAERQSEQLLDDIHDRPGTVPDLIGRLRETCIECHRQYRN